MSEEEIEKQVPHFAFTGFEKKDLEKCKKVIATLGGKWDGAVTENTTHVVACRFVRFPFHVVFVYLHPQRKLSRSEKTVAALAMGAWVVSEHFISKAWEVYPVFFCIFFALLTSIYFFSFLQLKAFPNPSEYQYDPESSPLAKGAVFWKERLRESQEKAFSGVRGMFCVTQGEESLRIK